MNDNEPTASQQIAHLEAMASTMRDDLAEARAGLLAKPGDERLTKRVSALERLLKGVSAKVERLRRGYLSAQLASDVVQWSTLMFDAAARICLSGEAGPHPVELVAGRPARHWS